MNDENTDFDPRLAEIFAREHAHLPAEPFATAALRAVAAERKRATFVTRSLQAIGLIALVALSPLLIAASTWVSARLDELFAAASAWIASPLGLAAVGISLLVAVATKRARIW